MNDRLQSIHDNALPSWLRDRTPDRAHFHRRRYTRGYCRKRGIVRNVWIGTALVMLCGPDLAWVCAESLFATFLSFAILDETA
jgi:hypothetical protein